jgi:energy-coupling factor transporter transmembrane protein EcfT
LFNCSFASSDTPYSIYLKIQVRSKVDRISVLFRVDATTALLFLISLVEDSVNYRIIIFMAILLSLFLIIILMHLRLLSLEISLRMIVFIILLFIFFWHGFKHCTLIKVPVFSFIRGASTSLSNTSG